MDKDFRERFLENRDDTGRYIEYSIRTGKSYCIEPIGDGRGGDWGSENPATKQIEHKKGDGKHTGSIKIEQSIINEENGFKASQIHHLGAGESVRSFIDELDAKYPDKVENNSD